MNNVVVSGSARGGAGGGGPHMCVGCLCGSIYYTQRMHTVGSVVPNKRQCQSRTHLGARSRVSLPLINGAEVGWELADGFPSHC